MSRFAPRLASLPVAAILAASLSGAAIAQEPVTVIDVHGDPISISDASRIATLGGVVTEIVYALGAADRIVAVDEGSFHPAEALTENPVVGYHRFLAAEPVVAAAPTLVLGAAETGPPEVLDQLRDAGITLLLLADAQSVDEARAAIGSVGTALGLAAEADDLISQLSTEVADAEGLVATVTDTPRVLFYFRPPGAPSLVSGTATAADAMIRLAGGENVFPFFEGFIPMTPEGIVDVAPDVILTTDASLREFGGIEGLMAQPGVAQTPAAQNGRIVSMDDLYLLGFGPRTGQAIADLALLLHPDLAG